MIPICGNPKYDFASFVNENVFIPKNHMIINIIIRHPWLVKRVLEILCFYVLISLTLWNLLRELTFMC